MGRVRFRLSVLGALVAACGSGAEVVGSDAGPDAPVVDASSDVAPIVDASSEVVFASAIDTCLAGGFVLSGQTSAPPGFMSICGHAALATSSDDAGVAMLSLDNTDAVAMTFDFVPAADGVSSVTTAVGEPNLSATCYSCVCLPNFYPTAMAADAGALVFSNGVAFVSATGATQATTSCGDAAVQATVWAVCQDAGSAPLAEPMNVPFVVGTHACQSTLATVWKNATAVAASAQGSISIAQAGTQLTVQYDASWMGSGSLELAVVTPNVALGSPDQQVMLGCNGTGDNENGFGGGDGGAMPVTAASLVVEGSTLVLSLTGTMGSGTGCESATHALVLACSP